MNGLIINEAFRATLATMSEPMQQLLASPQLVPASEKLNGISLGEWHRLFFACGLTGATDMMNRFDVLFGNVLLLARNWGRNPRDVSVKPDTFILNTIAGSWGERYDDGSEDDIELVRDGQPAAESWRSSVELIAQTLNGRVFRPNNLQEYYTPPTPLEIGPYAKPQRRPGGRKAVGAVWFRCYGFLIKPLSGVPNPHTLSVTVKENFFGQPIEHTNTWNITVV